MAESENLIALLKNGANCSFYVIYMDQFVLLKRPDSRGE